MICAPTARTMSGVSPLTVAWVPTGMKIGVSTVPCGVVSRPVRAAPSRCSTVKEMDMGKDKMIHRLHRGHRLEASKTTAVFWLLICVLCVICGSLSASVSAELQVVLCQPLADLGQRGHAEVL